ncbi:GNAT family N-acetyltransferase [Brucella sp. RRSP16]|uniref:GNAT family N-acetyltransferase n=1 Tax=Brucella TaxID=234 RepID=UPI000DD8C999|nr:MULTISPECIES: GNAT family N-acetyltransferase [Brucella]MBM7322259.1 GNAT family N-acetyltransferase [Agrobacterium sp. S2]MCH6206395.1 GNAT family N-acetyltransferase [Brucella ciceri]
MATILLPKRPLIVALSPESAAPAFGQNRRDFIVSESKNYCVRSLLPSDVTRDFLSWFSKEDILRGLNLADLDFDVEKLRRFVAGFDNVHNYMLGIFSRKTNLLIGFYTLDVNLQHKVGVITTAIGHDAHRGAGVMWETIDGVLDYFYDNRDIEKITARVLAKNYSMLFNLKQNLRFVLEARLRHEARAPDGRRLDVLVFASYRTDPKTGKRHRVDPQEVVDLGTSGDRI